MAEREYRSALRREQAVQTRRRIVGAARELFGTEGFAATTVAAIADRAGVSVPTVYATLGSKAAIVQALLTQIEDEADDPGQDTASVTRESVAAETDPRRKLVLSARWHRRFYSGGRTVIAAAAEARGDPAVRTLHEQGERTARDWHAALVASLIDGSALRPGRTREQAVDIAWALCGPDLYLRVTGSCGWSDDAYESFLIDLLQTQLLSHTIR